MHHMCGLILQPVASMLSEMVTNKETTVKLKIKGYLEVCSTYQEMMVVVKKKKKIKIKMKVKFSKMTVKSLISPRKLVLKYRRLNKQH